MSTDTSADTTNERATNGTQTGESEPDGSTTAEHELQTETASDAYGPDDGLLVLQNVTKRFGGLTAVDDLSFAVEEGEILGFIGPNGAGKSTTFNCVTGVYPPTAGTVHYDGEDVTGTAAHGMVKRGLARTFQSFRPLEDRSVLDNVALALTPDKLFSLSGFRGGCANRPGRSVSGSGSAIAPNYRRASSHTPGSSGSNSLGRSRLTPTSS